MDTAQALELLRQLSPQAIRDRLSELDAEEQALRTLLRAAQRREQRHPHARMRCSLRGSRASLTSPTDQPSVFIPSSASSMLSMGGTAGKGSGENPCATSYHPGSARFFSRNGLHFRAKHRRRRITRLPGGAFSCAVE